MKAFSIYSALVLFVLAFTGCSKDNDLQMQNGFGEDESSSFLKNVKIKTFTILSSSGDMVFTVSPENDCFSQGWAQANITGTGIATRLGNFAIESHFCVDQQGLPMTSMNGSLTAANGDKILIYMEDPSVGFYFDPNDGLFHMEFVVVGGTGRFTNATGTVSNWGHVDFVNNVWDFEGQGTIIF
jgi:hypothetical protein